MLPSLSVEELCRKLKPVFGKRIDEVYLKYKLSDREGRFEIEQALNALYHKHLNESLLSENVLLEPPSKEVIQGEYPLSVIAYADKELYPFCLREKDWIRHVCISGMSGSGKTTLAYHIIGDFIKKRKPFLIFDWKKSFRPLMLVDKDVLCFTVGNKKVTNLFRININKPPRGVEAKEWINILCDLITESFSASYGVHKILLQTLDQAFRDFKVYEGSKHYPNWYQIRDRLLDKDIAMKGRRGRESEWITSALRIAHTLTFGNFGEAINYKSKDASTVEDLFNSKVIFELNALNNAEKKFFCGFILTYIYKLKKANQSGICEDFKYAILVDEAHNIFLKDRAHFVTESITDTIYREIREYGIGLICLDQHISKLSDTVSGNSACNIAFQQMLSWDVDCVSGIMQLRERKKYFSMLPVGTAIVKLAERYFEPFLIKVPFVELKNKAVSDEDVVGIMSKFIKEKGKITKLKEKSNLKNVKKEIERVDRIFKQSGVNTNEVYKEAQEEINKLDKVSYMKAYLCDYIRERLKEGYKLEDVKNHLIKYGYSLKQIEEAVEILYSTRNFSGEKSFTEKEENVTTSEKQKVYKEENSLNSYSINNIHKKILQHLQYYYPTTGTTKFYQDLNLSARKGNKFKNELIKLGLIKIREERSNKGWTKIIELTEKGSKYIKENPGSGF